MDTDPYQKENAVSETVSNKAIGFINPDRIRPTKQEMIGLLNLRRIQWYGWGGQPKNLSLVRDYFKNELCVWCAERGTILSDREATDVVETFYKAVGW